MAIDNIQSHIPWAVSQILKHWVGGVNDKMTRLYPGHELPQFQELAAKKWEQMDLELKINHTPNNWNDVGQTTDDQFEDGS